MKEREVEGVLQFNNFPNRKNSKMSLPQPSSRVLTPASLDPFSDKIDLFVRAFERVCLKLQTTIQMQNRKILSMEETLLHALTSRFDKLISINQNIREGLERNGSPAREKDHGYNDSKKSYMESQVEKVSSLKESLMSLNKVTSVQIDSKAVGLVMPPPLTSLDRTNNYQISPIRKKTVSVQESVERNKPLPNFMQMGLLPQKIIDNTVVAFCSPLVSENSQSEINRWVGNFYNQTASTYFQLYSKGNISYQDMKIKFSYDIINETLNLSIKWSEFCRQKEGASSKERSMMRRPQFYYMLNEASKRSLQFLINKYPPSRRKRIDTDISQKIKDTTKEFSIVKYDMLSGARMDIGLDQKQTDFTKEIKVWLNKLVTETKNQFPLFQQKMRSIFVDPDESIEMTKSMNSELEFVISSKISEGTVLFSQEELEAPGLQLKSTQLLRILVKWCEELSSYFQQHEEKIYGNASGFKTVRGSLPIKIPKSRLDLLVANLKDIYQNEVLPCLEIQRNNIGQLVTDLINLAADGIVNYQFLNQREISIVKLSDFLNQSLKAHVLNFLNLMLGKLVQVRTRYEDQKLESNIHLVTFGVMDILRCRCVGSKSEIYRIYKEILSNDDYFEIIRVKNKLNTPTRDIILNCKIKQSFLICQVQLSLGEAEEQVNDHFCHFLYELERTNFGVIFECASQICNLDPRMQYINQHKDIKFKGPVQKKALLLQNIRQNSQQFICHFNHPEMPMYSESNCQPFCCALCTSFKPGFNLILPYLRCGSCNACICPECVMMIGKNNVGFIEKYTSQGSNFQKLSRFFYPQHLYENVESSIQSVKQIPAQLVKFAYILHMAVDSVGHIPTVYKRYKNSSIQTFSTLKNIPSKTKASSLSNWNYMVGMKPYERKTIQELKDYRKYSINMEWSELQQILKQNNISDVIVVIDQTSKSALIVDIVESEEDIEACLIKREGEKTISEVNRSKLNFVELTSKSLTDISLLSGIEAKKNIKILNLWENKIKNIDLLSEFKEVRELFLRQNQVESIESILGMKHLEIAVISSNKIRGSLPVLPFPHLSVLDISLNQFSDISNISKSDLRSLTFFKLVNTKIREIPLMNLQRLETFWFDYNSIYNLASLSLSSLPKLAKVSGTHNNISGQLPELPFPKLQSLILNYNQIISLQKFSQAVLQSLKILSLHHNSISGALPSFNLPSLVKLDLSYNKIASLSYCQFSNTRLPLLESLDLKFNEINGDLPLMQLKSLRKLDLSNNQLSGIVNLQTSKLPALEYLDLSKNQIKGALCALRSQKLRKLILSFNQISDIKNLSQSKLPKLEILKLNNNVIRSSIPKMYFQSLKRIDLSSNFVSSEEFLRNIHLLPSLEKVFLINNPPTLKNSFYSADSKLQSLIIFNEEYNQ